MTVQIIIDHENNGDTWWDALRATGSDDPTVNEIRAHLLENEDIVQATSDAADRFIAWAETLPGWDDGPAHAENPVFLAPDEE